MLSVSWESTRGRHNSRSHYQFGGKKWLQDTEQGNLRPVFWQTNLLPFNQPNSNAAALDMLTSSNASRRYSKASKLSIHIASEIYTHRRILDRPILWVCLPAGQRCISSIRPQSRRAPIRAGSIVSPVRTARLAASGFAQPTYRLRRT